MLPAPVGGLNGRDTYAAMPMTDALVLDNLFPYNTSVDTRGGTANWSTGMAGPVESLEVYNGGAGSDLLAFSLGSIFKVNAGGAVGAAIHAGMVSSRVTSTMFSNAGAQFLLIFSGADAPMSYDGAATANLVITGLTGVQTTTHSPHPFKGRLFFAQQNQLGFYYLDVGAIQGASHYFDLSQIAFKGGYIQTITSFSQDSGTGPQDYALFITSEGEYIVYAGTDPSDAAHWALVGRYYSAPPIGRKGWFKFRSDVYIITEEGIMSFTQIRQTGEGVLTQEYITAKLGRQYTDYVRFKDVHGWCGIIYPRGNMLIVNVPFSTSLSGEYAQFAMNTNTNAWGRFRQLHALTWALFNGRAYYGTYDGKVVKYDEGYTDNGAEIHAAARQAWHTFDSDKVGIMDKQFHVAQVVLKADGRPSIACSVNVNFEDEKPTPLEAVASVPASMWDLSTWDVDSWGGSTVVQNIDISIGKIGYVASMWLEMGSLTSTVQWIASRILLEPTKRAFI
jgi:hypothetical protein